MADSLVLDIYGATNRFPPEERFGLQSPLATGYVELTASLKALLTSLERAGG
jgi:hypothetical protein